MERALAYMALEPGTPMRDIRIDRVFIGSCTNSRIEDLRAAAAVVRGHAGGRGRPGPRRSGLGAGEAAAEAEGLDRIFRAAGFEWREPGCSMCLGMNPDVLAPGERCASTSNRNFEGRQGRGGRTHLCQPGDGSGRGDRRSLRRRPRAGKRCSREAVHPHHWARRGPRPARRRHGSDPAQAVPEAHRAHGLGRVPLLRLARQEPRLRAERARGRGRAGSSSRAGTSAAARRASTRPGHCRTSASRWSSRRRSPTSSSRTA